MRDRLFPIMHAVGIRRDVLEKNRWLAASVYKAFLQANESPMPNSPKPRRLRSACLG